MEISHSSNLLLSASMILVTMIIVMLKPVSSLDHGFAESLLSLKSDITDDQNSLGDWSDKTSVCSWSGVTCDRGSTAVIALDLSAKRLRGSISGEKLEPFAELVELNVSHNSFSGPFPGGLSRLKKLRILDAFSNSFSGPLPRDVSELENLQVLNLAGSYFEGPIPPEYGSFRRLEFLHLAGNLLGGEIPPELGNLKTVAHMEIGYNSFQGIIPRELGNMSELRYLDIAGANLSGSIPAELSNLTKLESLFLFRNRLSGEIPLEFGRISSLQSLDLSDNLITGTIPESFSELNSLKLLSIMYNAMNGPVPDGIADLRSLETLMIWSNNFQGTLPASLGRNSKLKWVDASSNNLTGAIPPDICSGGELRKLILFSNKLSGNISRGLQNCSSLVRLRLEDNLFSGQIPTNLNDMEYLDLSRNNFTGGIPEGLSRALKLWYFNVSDNPRLGGAIPPGTFAWPNLQNFSASSCDISGTIPSFQGCSSEVAIIELSSNSLSGSLPESISECRSLERVDFSNNRLSGHIPESVASLPHLSVVNLSRNSFTGTIPAGLGRSSSLKLLDVSGNDISGTIPAGKAFREMGERSFSGNPRLCGEPLRRCSFGGGRIRKLVWVLFLSASVVVLTILLVLALLHYLRRRSKTKWKIISYNGLPNFTAEDVSRTLSSCGSTRKAVLPTGITVSVKRIEFGSGDEPDRVDNLRERVARIGGLRHKNLTRLVGVCYDERAAWLLYDYFPNGSLAERLGELRDWGTKYRIVIGVARGLCFLHHRCSPAMGHGDLRSSNVVLDEFMEPHLTEFGIYVTGEFGSASKEILYTDIYRFGEILLEILSNGRLTNAGETLQNKQMNAILTEILGGEYNEVAGSTQEEIKLVLEVALLCTRTRPTNRPSMEDALKLLSASQSQRK